MHITLRTVDAGEVGRAYKWHSDFAATNDAIFPRSQYTFTELVFARAMWCAVSSEDEYLGLSYANYDEPKDEWEIGGLMVSESARNKGLGRLLMQLPLAHMIFNENPFHQPDKPSLIVAHVLAGNQAPRGILPAIGFAHSHPVEIPGELLPGLRQDPDGMVRGDEFHLKVPDALYHLADTFAAWSDRLSDGTPATIDLLDGVTVTDWVTALRDIADKLASRGQPRRDLD